MEEKNMKKIKIKKFQKIKFVYRNPYKISKELEERMIYEAQSSRVIGYEYPEKNRR